MNHRNEPSTQARNNKTVSAPDSTRDLPIPEQLPGNNEEQDYHLADETDDARAQNRMEGQEYDDYDFGQDHSGGYGSGYSGGSYGYGMSPHADPYKPAPEDDYKPMQYWGGEASDQRGAPRQGGENGSRLGHAYQPRGTEADRPASSADDE